LDKMKADVVVIRHSVSGAPQIVADKISASVVNAGDGLHAHPTQALLDFFTIEQTFGHFDGLEVAIIGDIKHSRVARSNIVGLVRLGAKVRVYAPATLMPIGIESLPVRVCKNINEAFECVDVVMGLRIQLERQQKGAFPTLSEYNKFFGINAERMKLAKPNAVVLHPGPVNRGVELSYDVLDKDFCLKDEQVTNGVAVRMALLEMLCKNK
ncbi:MAG: aspartate carbamoyltransferase catalytic subunit, partial [Clostridia bacterium]